MVDPQGIGVHQRDQVGDGEGRDDDPARVDGKVPGHIQQGTGIVEDMLEHWDGVLLLQGAEGIFV